MASKLREVDRWRMQLGDRLHEITYNQLTTNSESVLSSICDFISLDKPNHWLEKALKSIRPAKQTVGETLKLPPALCKAFNSYQERFSFVNRANTQAKVQNSKRSS